MEIITNVIWIDPKIQNEENTEYKKELEKIGNIKLKCFVKVNDAINHLKTIKFQETKIIISGKIFFEFVQLFQENILDMRVVPKIIIFTSNKEKFIEKSRGYKSTFDDIFYINGGIKILFEDIKAFITNENKEVNSTKSLKSQKKNNNEIQFTFEYIDSLEKLALPLFYKTLIDTISKENMEKYTDLLYNQYSKSNNDLKELLYAIKSIPNIPIELLSKFYARLYTAESDFYKSINKDLGLNKIDNYLPYIKTLYEGVKLKALPLASKNNILFRGSKIENIELKNLKNYLNKKDPNLPGAIGFCKSFLSFSKDRGRAEFFLKGENKLTKSKVLYILLKDESLGFNLSTHGDLEEISFYDWEKEVLFFPFSSFEIKEIKEVQFESEKIFEIKLLYLGKYLKKIENDEQLINKTTNLPESEFKNQIIKFGLIKPEKIENINIKSLYNCYKKYEKEINKNNAKKNIEPENNELKDQFYEINLKYEGNGTKENIFGEEFIENNIDNIELNINGIKSNLVKRYELKKGENNIKLIIKNKKITDFSHMFHGCKKLKNIEELKLLITNCCIDFSFMFFGCSSLSDIKSLESWDVSTGINFRGMFSGCSSLSDIKPLENWNVSKGNNFEGMFSICSSLSDIKPLEKWDVSTGNDFKSMFYECSSLLDKKPLEKWKISNEKYNSLFIY